MEGAIAEGNNPRDTAATGALAGTALGGLAGLLFGVSVFSLPVLGAAVLAGPIYTAIMGASAGGIGEAAWLAGVPEQDAQLQTEALRSHPGTVDSPGLTFSMIALQIASMKMIIHRISTNRKEMTKTTHIVTLPGLWTATFTGSGNTHRCHLMRKITKHTDHNGT